MVPPSDETKYLRRPGEGRRNFSMKIVGGNVLTRADTPHREPDALAEAVAVGGIQATTVVGQVALAGSRECGS